MDGIENFEGMTIGQLRKLTEQYEILERENKILRAKYPTKAKQIPNENPTAEELIEELG